MICKFPAMRGIQANAEYYVCMVPLGVLPKLFIESNSNTTPELRAQRTLHESCIPEIQDYILRNRDTYVFSALVASIDGDMRFTSFADGEIGELEIDMRARFLINDGQHRKAAILKALEHDESLGTETITVVLYADKGLRRSQQMYTDLSKHTTPQIYTA